MPAQSNIIPNGAIPLAASGANTVITVTCPALGVGATNNVVNAYGYQEY